MIFTPGAYLKHRRTAAGLAIVDVAAQLVTEPRMAEHVRAEWIELIEADVHPATFHTIVALRCAYPFSLDVLERLVAIHMGAPYKAPQLCRICACSECDPCVDTVAHSCCAWAGPDLCTGCRDDDPITQVARIHAAAGNSAVEQSAAA